METPSRLALAGALALVLACVGKETTDPPCPAGWALCGGCMDPAGFQTDAWNCGGCGVRCGSDQACVAGQCVCPAGLTPCGGRCVDLATDPRHCGSCDVSCNLGTCSAGACACAANTTRCTGAGAQCVDLASDRDNCGSCRAACPTLESCRASACVCAAPNVTCSGACTDLTTSRAHCGACGRACPNGATCAASTCRCQTGPVSGCGGACCAGGTACCTAGGCPTQHTNGLGGSFYNCDPLYAPHATTWELAVAAANAWMDGIDDLNRFPSCVARQAGSQCAVWCYGTSPVAGHVQRVSSGACLAPTLQSSIWR